MAKRKRGKAKRKATLPFRWALLISLLAEAITLALLWLIIGNLVALQMLASSGIWLGICGLAGCLVGWFCLSWLAGRAASSGRIAMVWVLLVALAVLELKLIAAGQFGIGPWIGG